MKMKNNGYFSNYFFMQGILKFPLLFFFVVFPKEVYLLELLHLLVSLAVHLTRLVLL